VLLVWALESTAVPVAVAAAPASSASSSIGGCPAGDFVIKQRIRVTAVVVVLWGQPCRDQVLVAD
jgi:hypothetical protein